MGNRSLNNWIKFIIVLIFVLVVIIFIRTSNGEVSYAVSDIDGKKYLVRDLDDKQKAANMLARIKQNIDTLINHMYKNKDTKYSENRQYVEQLASKIKGVVISESKQNSKYTSYSVNKGEELVFCVRSKRTKEMHDINLVMYVALHEIAHIGCPEFGHGPLFKKIFAFFTTVAIQQGLYQRIDFREEPTEYCGLMITDSIV